MYDAQKKVAWSSLKAGIVITAALVLVFVTVFFSGSIGRAISPTVPLHARIDQVSGLREGAPVWLYGVEVGSVKKIRIIAGGSLVTVAVKKDHLGFVRANATVRIRTMGLLGDKYVEVDPGSAEGAAIAPGDTIPGQGAFEIEEILQAGAGFTDRVGSAALSLDSLLSAIRGGRGTLGQLVQDSMLYQRLERAVRLFSVAIGDWQRSEGTLKLLVRDPALHEDLISIMSRVTALLDSVHSGSGIAGALLNGDDIVDRTRTILEHVDELIVDIRENPKRYFSVRLF